MSTLPEQFRRHAASCAEVGSVMYAPLYATLMAAFADDLEAGGPVAEICRDHLDAAPGAVVQLRILGSLHRRVLTGLEPSLAGFYRNVGGWREPTGVWPVARRVLGEEVAAVRSELADVPQTNEVGRAVALVLGLSDVVRRTGASAVRLFELGSSGGLNLVPDRYRITGPGWAWGPESSPVRIGAATDGPVSLSPFTIVARRGCDLNPVDPRSERGWLRLRSFCWPDHRDRDARLLHALTLARHTDALVERAPAGAWLEQALLDSTPAGREQDDVLDVVWHSVFTQYLDPAENARIDAAVAAAAAHRTVARVSFEPGGSGLAGMALRTAVLRDGAVEERVLATAGPHGAPLRLLDDDGAVDDAG